MLQQKHRANTTGRHALWVDPQLRAANLKRLRRIEGQVRGLHRMIEEDRYCADILIQVSAVHEALRKVSQGLLEHHLRHCATSAIQSTPQKAEQMYSELVDLFMRHSR